MFVCVCMGGDSNMLNLISMAANIFFTKSFYVFTRFPTSVLSFVSICVHKYSPKGKKKYPKHYQYLTENLVNNN